MGWRLDRQLVYDEVTNYGTVPFRLFRCYIFLIRYVIPVIIGVIFVNELLR